ncbi:MAG: hypothetical protein LBR51_03995 [Bacteroidales bacterium]|jgi:hypothetical protein|nr:hypothetical protein [Bacteroidales bacterium]
MSKNKKNPQKQVLLSPENYIRQKSRALPIVKCVVNKGWEEDGIASILIVRQHSNGNFTFCSYLVDKDCLGVKDTMYFFNEPQETLDEYEKQITSNYKVEEISYDLAHNIIFASIEFAEEYGFKPHRDFTSVTQYFLEEDTDDIPLIEIHCGNENGEPVYVNNGYETPALQNKIVNQLERSAGKGHYEVYINTDDDRMNENYLDEDEFEDDEDEIYWRWYKKIDDMDDKEFNQTVYESFLDWINRSKKGKFDEDNELIVKMRALTDIIADSEDMYDDEKTDGYYYQLLNDLENIDTVANDNVPNSLFPSFENNGKELAEDFIDIFLAISALSKKKEIQKEIALFATKYKDCGAFAYLKFMFSGFTKANKLKDIEKEIEKFPDYFLLKLLQKEIETAEMSSKQTREELLNLVKGRTLTTFEMSQFVADYATRVFEMMNTETPDHLEKLFALEMLLDGEFAEEKCDFTSRILLSAVRLLKINLIIENVVRKKR